MSGPGYDRIVASMVLALALAIPLGCIANAQQRGDPRVQQRSDPWISHQTDSWARYDPWFAQPRPKAAIMHPRGKAATGQRRGKAAVTTAKPTDAATSPAPAEAATAPQDPAASAPSSKPTTAPKDSGISPPASEAAAAPKDAAASAPASGASSAAGSEPTTSNGVPTAAPADVASAPPPEPPPDPLAALDPADRPVAEKIRDLLAAKSDKFFAGKRERSAVDAFYQARNLAPLWLDKGIENARAKAVLARLRAAESEGLVAADYKIPNLVALTPDALAEAELKLTQTVLTYARHLQAGRFPYTRVSSNIELPQQPPDNAEVLTRIADAADAGAALEHYSPPHAGYKALKAKLAEARGSSAEEPKIAGIPDGPLLRPGMDDPRVPLLRKRLNLDGNDSSQRYEGPLVEAVKGFQEGAGLTTDGVIGPGTLRALNGVVAPRRSEVIDLIIANMERWRWYPRDLGKAHVMVNQPDFTLKVMHNGAQVWTTRIVIGKPSMATPLLTETMKYITLNPTWNVPPSIVYNEYLPALRQDPTVLSRMGLRLVHNRDGSVHIYQPPGDGNALGRIRFNFPNRFLVYQHDTPDKHFFAHETRAYSHGCMRVQDPAKYAEVLFNIARPDENWTAEKVKRMFGGAEQDIQLPEKIWVHLSYQSAFVDETGKLQTRRDVYNLDSRTLAAIKSERGMVEPAEERRRELAGSGSNYRRVAYPGSFSSFFGGLFGGPAQPPAPVPQRRVTR
jgi:L,D-transpeptidase YcbB